MTEEERTEFEVEANRRKRLREEKVQPEPIKKIFQSPNPEESKEMHERALDDLVIGRMSF